MRRGQWPQSSIDFLNSLSWEEVARYRGTTLRGRTPKTIQYRLADAIDVTMIGMDAGGAPGELAWKLHFFAARVLRGPKRAGRRTESLAKTLSKRLDKFMAGDWEALWHSVRSRPMKARGPRTDEAVADHVTLLMRDGLYSKAAQALEQAPMAPATLATHTSLRALNPDGVASGAMPAPPAPAPPPLSLTLMCSSMCSPSPLGALPMVPLGGGWRTMPLSLPTVWWVMG